MKSFIHFAGGSVALEVLPEEEGTAADGYASYIPERVRIGVTNDSGRRVVICLDQTEVALLRANLNAMNGAI